MTMQDSRIEIRTQVDRGVRRTTTLTENHFLLMQYTTADVPGAAAEHMRAVVERLSFAHAEPDMTIGRDTPVFEEVSEEEREQERMSQFKAVIDVLGKQLEEMSHYNRNQQATIAELQGEVCALRVRKAPAKKTPARKRARK